MGSVRQRVLKSLLSVEAVALIALLTAGLVPLSGPDSDHRQPSRPIPLQTETAMLRADDGKPDNGFGLSVDVHGDVAVIGSPFDDESGSRSGAVYIFERDDEGTWSQRSKLSASGKTHSRFFGLQIGLDADTIFVGRSGSKEERGRVDVFTRANSGEWTEQARIQASDGETGDGFGCRVTIDGDTAGIAACSKPRESYSHYVFNRDSDGSWTEKAKLLAEPGHSFSAANALDGSTILIGAIDDDERRKDSGAAYVFVMDQNNLWTQQAKLTASDPERYAHFGTSVDVDGDTAVIGTSKPWDLRSNRYKGKAYVFTRDGAGAWTERVVLQATKGTPRDSFGNKVAIDGETILIGADTDNEKGKVHVFQREASGKWAPQAHLLPNDRVTGNHFGVSLAVDDETVVVGTWPMALGTESPEGSAYVFAIDRKQ
jgi:hypothetical protein